MHTACIKYVQVALGAGGNYLDNVLSIKIATIPSPAPTMSPTPFAGLEEVVGSFSNYLWFRLSFFFFFVK